ncbi:alpha-amylase family glycosyl hydrolase [Herbiconiux sp. L3-i23]|uniref:alpha-amylase family glycosyl hydrolase n=1 Tax=Herbiconiux sp. L3-i23 TaxID=2905871 RepID=UPI002058CB16|nr:alpha-amylase family glycosyl hydrolase [Herbiconiux sp. L3-i23]BDI22869.1 alpha-glucosidase [Herbiconiux sp. L3-i23]
MDERWWETGVIYEVYPRSFADTDADGIGDLRGVIEHLHYIASLGVDGIWLTPFQPSPGVDQGYDVSDYCDVDPLFGTLADFDELLADAHALDIRVLVDLVPNHTSVDNERFIAAVAAGPGSPERELFHFAQGRDPQTPPNNWLSVFGGPAWSRVAPDSADDTQWYLHLFSPAQPDWNWRNPAVGDYFEGVLRFWLDRGVDGVRVDVAHGLFKTEGLPDSEVVPTVIDGLRSNPLAMDQEPVHDVYRRWRRVAEEYRPPRLLVGEVNLIPARSARYTRADELHQTFAFSFARLGWEPDQWLEVGRELDAVRREYGASPTWALENHDLVRSVTRFGGGERGLARARAGLLSVLGFPGGAYVFQGQELGLPEVDVPLDARKDPMWFRGGVSRDGVRVPMPWTRSTDRHHGFVPEGAVTPPWLPTPDWWGENAVDVQEATDESTLHLFRTAIATRKRLLADGVFAADEGAEWSLADDGLLVCRRDRGAMIAVAMGDNPAVLPEGQVVLASAPQMDGRLPADAAAWIIPD